VLTAHFIMPKKEQLSASLEDYLEAIYHIIEEHQVARGKNIVERLDVSGASVTEALRSLSKKGLINYAPYEVITLTEKGQEVAGDIVFRHTTLKRFFTEILVLDDTISETAACQVEHAAPAEVIDRMIRFMEFIEACPRGGDDLIQGFTEFCRQGKTRADCEKCVSSCFPKG
jgi:DtxR family Mn-dependent transcriptional regulator